MIFFKKLLIYSLLIIFLVFFVYWFYQLAPVDLLERFQKVTIASGQSLGEVAELLAENNLIKSKSFFKLYTVITGRAGQLKPGDYLLSSSWSSGKILNRLVTGLADDIEVTIFEGESIKDINQKLSRLGILKSGESLPPRLEGYAFPDTYRFFPDSSVVVIVEKFENAFKQKAQPILEKNTTHTERELLIMASMIEKEVPSINDRAVVAGILWKRLSVGMPLQVDATVCYANFQTVADCYPLAKSYFDVVSRYNTYKYQGLPPGPIGNPGVSALQAALYPKTSPYWYYLSDPKTKKTIFSKTLDEHNLNRGKYLGL